jgi:predicted HAD superfamily Cof-like phosphohydrolase
MTPDEMVREFHRACGVVDRATPGIPDNEVEALRFALISEECKELTDALAAGDLPAIAKEGADVVYVVLGTFLAYGIDFDPVFAAVHQSNMSKVGPGASPAFREDGKVAKGDGYAEPDIASVLADQLKERDA